MLLITKLIPCLIENLTILTLESICGWNVCMKIEEGLQSRATTFKSRCVCVCDVIYYNCSVSLLSKKENQFCTIWSLCIVASQMLQIYTFKQNLCPSQYLVRKHFQIKPRTHQLTSGSTRRILNETKISSLQVYPVDERHARQKFV